MKNLFKKSFFFIVALHNNYSISTEMPQDECAEFQEFFNQSKKILFDEYGKKHDLSKLKLLNPLEINKLVRNNPSIYNPETHAIRPFIATYSITKDDGKTKTINYLTTCHNDPKNADFLNQQKINYDLVIGEYAAIRTLEGRYHELFTQDQEFVPFYDKSRMQSITDPNTDVVLLEAFCKKNNYKIINGEQDLKKYLNDCKKIGWSPDQIAAIPKCLEIPPSQGPIVTFPREETLIDPNSPNPTAKRHDYKSMSCYSRTLIFMRDCHVLKTLLDSLQDHDNILILYGNFHWLAQQDVLEEHLGKPKIITYEEFMADKQA